MTTPENPPAFPCTGEGLNSPQYTQPGMTLRDYFAGQALAGMMAGRAATAMDGAPSEYALNAYEVADAMLAARAAS